jgi:predicted RNA polymerase sigma factor
MCILPNATAAVPVPRTPAHALPPAARQPLALDALAGCPITELARPHDVSRKFVYQQANKAEQAVAEAFTPTPRPTTPCCSTCP